MDIEEYALAHHHFWVDYFYNKNLETLINFYSPKRIIDIGCGDGAFIYTLKALGLIEQIEEIWASDLSHNRLLEVKKISSKIRTVQDDAQELLNIPKNYFDLVISTQVIEHVKDDLKMLIAMEKICKPGGIIFVETVIKNRYSWYFYKNAYGENVLDPTHEREYLEEKEITDKIKLTKLKLIASIKEPLKFPVIDFFARRIKKLNDPMLFKRNKLLKLIRQIKVPIFGYFKWSLIINKK